MAHFGRIMRNVPNFIGLTSEELLLKKAIPAAKRTIDEARVSYTGALKNGFIIERAVTPSGKAFTMRNIQPYAIDIETGKPSRTVWEDSTNALEKWRQFKGIWGGNYNFVVVGQSGGGNRITGKPFPLGVHFMKAGFQSIFPGLTQELERDIERGMK